MRLHNFCYFCGLVDHEMTDCTSEVSAEDLVDPPFGDWLRGIPPRIASWQLHGSGGGSVY